MLILFVWLNPFPKTYSKIFHRRPPQYEFSCVPSQGWVFQMFSHTLCMTKNNVLEKEKR